MLAGVEFGMLYKGMGCRIRQPRGSYPYIDVSKAHTMFDNYPEYLEKIRLEYEEKHDAATAALSFLREVPQDRCVRHRLQ